MEPVEIPQRAPTEDELDLQDTILHLLREEPATPTQLWDRLKDHLHGKKADEEMRRKAFSNAVWQLLSDDTLELGVGNVLSITEPPASKSMGSFFVISDVLYRSPLDIVTGYWTGTDLVDSLTSAKRYASLSEAEIVVRDGNFYDPSVHEVEESPEGLTKTRFIDMVNEYGRAGGK